MGGGGQIVADTEQGRGLGPQQRCRERRWRPRHKEAGVLGSLAPDFRCVLHMSSLSLVKVSTLMPILSDIKWFLLIHIYPVSLFPSLNIQIMIHWALSLAA